MMKLREISDSAAGLGNQLRAGIEMIQAVKRLVLLQPAHGEFWEETARMIEGGNPLSSMLPRVWPDALVQAVVAGEEAGKVEEVLKGIRESVQIQIDQHNNFKKMYYPLTIIVIGFVIFMAIMLIVVPTVSDSFVNLGVKADNPFSSLSAWMVDVYKNYGIVLGAGIVGGGILGIRWATSPEGRDAILDVLFGVPRLGGALVDMYFGIWGRYMAMMAGAGIDTARALRFTGNVLPGRLRPGVEAFERDIVVNSKSLGEAAKLDVLPADDPRQEWPFYICTAFMTADQTGDIEAELLRVSGPLIEEAVKRFDEALMVLNVLAYVIAGALLAVSLAAIYIPLYTAISHAH